jgi:hypothetical protein
MKFRATLWITSRPPLRESAIRTMMDVANGSGKMATSGSVVLLVPDRGQRSSVSMLHGSV